MSQLEFNPDGSLKIPESINKDLEEEKIKEEKRKSFDKQIVLNFLGSENDEVIRCEFEINIPPDIKDVKKKIIEIRDWVNRNKTTNGRCWIENNGDNYQLIISGRGSDGRCNWCRSFRTALDTKMFDLKIAVYQKNCCEFDKFGGYNKIRIL